MINSALGLFLSVILLIGMAGSGRAAPVHPAIPEHLAGGVSTIASDGPIEGMNEIFHMEAPRLLFLGGGIVTGLLLVSPGLEISELFGVLLGVIGSEFLYQTVYVPNFRSYHWF